MPHIHKLYDFTVSMFIVYGNKCLLHYHSKQGRWMQTGGHIELNEHPGQALWREITEETGIKQNQLQLINTQIKNIEPSTDSVDITPPFSISVHKINDATGHKHIDLSYLLVASSDKLKPAEGESEHIGWFPLTEFKRLRVPANVTNRYRFALDFVKNTKF